MENLSEAIANDRQLALRNNRRERIRTRGLNGDAVSPTCQVNFQLRAQS